MTGKRKQGVTYEIMAKIYHKKPWNRGVTAIAAVIVFITTYLLILPAITMTIDPVCGKEEHTHTDSCYQISYQRIPDCPYAEQHEGVLVLHKHDENCYDTDGQLICPLPEIEGHVHTAECYDGSEADFFSASPEGGFGADLSFEAADAFTSETDDEFSPASAPYVSCGKAELIEHAHTPECFDDFGNLICGKPMAIAHQHTDECFRYEEGPKVLACGKEEHIHDDSCYTKSEEVPEAVGSDEDLFTAGPADGDAAVPALQMEEAAPESDMMEEAVPEAGQVVSDPAGTQQDELTDVEALFSSEAGEPSAEIVSSAEEQTAVEDLFGSEAANEENGQADSGRNSAVGASDDADVQELSGEDLFSSETEDMDVPDFEEVGETDPLDSFSDGEEEITVQLDPEIGAGETTEAENTATAVLDYQGPDYKVHLTYLASAGLPDGAKLEAEEIDHDSKEYAQYLSQAKDALGIGEDQELPKEFARFFDIKILTKDENGNRQEFEPAGTVRVEIIYDEPVNVAGVEMASPSVVHFDEQDDEVKVEVLATIDPATKEDEEFEEADSEDVMDAVGAFGGETEENIIPEMPVQAQGETKVIFETDSFSVYGIIYTFDFVTEDGGRYDVLGGKDVYLSTILNTMFSDNSERQIANVQNVRTEVADTINGIGILGVQDTVDGNGNRDWVFSTNVAGLDAGVDLASLGLKIVVTYKDGTSVSFDVVVTGVEEAATVAEDGTSVAISAADGSYLPEEVEAKAEVVSDEGAESALEEIADPSEEEKGYKVFDISLDGVAAEDYADGFNVQLTLPENLIGKDFELYHVHTDVYGVETTEKIENVTFTSREVNSEAGLVAVSEAQFTTSGFSKFIVKYTVDFEYVDPETGEIFAWSWPGEGSYSIEDILWMSGVTDADISSVSLTRVLDMGAADNALYLEQKDGSWYLTSDVSFFDVYELTVMAGGVKYTILVADAAEVNLTTLTNSTSNITISEASTPTADGYSRTGTYSIHMTYVIDNNQLPLARANNTWVYDLSSFFSTPDVPFSSFPEGVSQSGLIMENNRTRGRYYISGDKVYLEMDQKYIDNSTDITGTLDITLQIDETKVGTKDSSTFTFPGSSNELTIPYKVVDVSDSWKGVSNSETGRKENIPIVAVQQENGSYKLNYTASVRPNASLDTLKLDDTLGIGQTVDKSSFVITTESGKTYTVPASSITDTVGGFTLDIASVVKAAGDTIKSGTKYEVKYSTIVDSDKVSGDTQITNSINWKWTGGEKPTNETTVIPHRATSVKKLVSFAEDANEDYLYTFNYTITVGDTTNSDVSGVTVTDSMMDYQELYGDIVVKNSSGQTVATMSGSQVKWVNDTTYGENQKPVFEYTFPNNSADGPYTITYTTRVPKNVGRGGSVNVTNNVNTNDGGSDGTGVPVDFPNPPSPGAKIDKAFVGWDSVDNEGKVTSKWSIDVNVDAKEEDLPLENVVVTESDCYTATAGWYPKVPATINYNSIVVRSKETGAELNKGSDYTVNESTGSISFNTLSNSVTIELTATGTEAMPENGWFENSASLTVNGKPAGSDKDNRQYGTMTFNKSVSYSEEEDVFTWTVKLNELANEVSPDTPVYFSDLLPEGMQLLNWSTGMPDNPSINVNVSGQVYDNWNQSVIVQGREVQRVNITPWTDYTKTVHMEKGFSENTYTITYKTRLTDAELASFANDEDGVKNYINTAYYYKTEDDPFDGQATRDVTYEYKTVDKTLVSVNDDNIYYRIEVNPKGVRLNDGQEMTLVDTLISTNVDLRLDSVLIKDEKGKGVAGAAAVYNDDNRTLTITVPDETRVFVEYAVVAQNIGDLTLKNKAELKGNKTWIKEDTSTRTVAKHGGTISSSTNITLSKIDENYEVNPEDGSTSPKELSGAEFAVYEQPINFTMTVNRQEVGEDNDKHWEVVLDGDPTGDGTFRGDPVRINRVNETESVYTSNNNGIVDLNELILDKYNKLYYWVETKAPDGYELDTTKHYFVLYDSDKDSEREGANKAIADKLDKAAEAANGIIVNKLSTGSTWTVVNRTDGLAVDVTKVWKDSAGNDKEFDTGKSVYFKLYQVIGDGSGTVFDPTSEDPDFTDDHYNATKHVWRIDYDTVEKKWETVDISGLPKEVEGVPCKYYVVEVTQSGTPLSSIKDYLVTYKAGSNQPKQDATEATLGRNGSFVINNSDLMSIKARKVWRDGGNTDGLRPTSITLHLVQDGKQMDISYDRTVEDDGSGKWETEWTRLESGHTYTVVEDALDIYDVTYSPAAGLTDEGTITVTNTDRRKTLTVNKAWVKRNNEGKYVNATAPANSKIAVQLKKNGELIDEQFLTGPEWTYTWKIQDYTDTDVFTVEEVPNAELFTQVVTETEFYDAQGYNYYHAYNEVQGKEMPCNPNSTNEWDYWIDINNTGGYIKYTQAQLGGKVVLKNTPFEPDKTKTQVVVRKLWVDDEGNELPSKDVADKTATVKLMKYRTEKVGTIIHFINLSDGKSVADDVKVGDGFFRIEHTNQVAKGASMNVANGDKNAANDNKPDELSSNCNLYYADPLLYVSFKVDGQSDIYVYFDGNPGNITVTNSEHAGDDIVTGPFEASKSKILSAPNFRDQFYDLPLTETEGDKTYELSYTVEEDPSVSGFTVSYSADGETFKSALTADDAASGAGESTFTVKNTFISLDNKVTVEKQWVMSDGASWPSDVSVKATLMQSVNGSDPVAVTLPDTCSERNNPATLSAGKASTTWDKLPLKDGEYDIVYTVEETSVEGMAGYAERFTSTENVSANHRHVVITNHEKPVTIPIEKTWSPLLSAETTWSATFQLQRQLRLAAVDGIAATREQYMTVEGVDDKGWSPAEDVTGKTVVLTQDTDSDSSTFADLPTVVKIDNKTYIVKYTVKETGLLVNGDDMLLSYEATVKGASPDDGYDISVVNKTATVDVPVEKTWEDFSGDGMDWSAVFRLQWAPVYLDENISVSGSFMDVRPIKEITITKEMMEEGDYSLGQRTFKNLPKYGKDSYGIYRIQYSLEEMSYNATDGTTTYTYSKADGYTPQEEDKHYDAFYPHDAGELSENNDDYYIEVSNRKHSSSDKRYIDIGLNKIWEEQQNNNDAWAKFELKRYVHTEYRVLDPTEQGTVKVTLKRANGTTISELEVPKKSSVHFAATFKPHDNEEFVALQVNDDARPINLQTPTQHNTGDEIVRSGVYYPENDMTVTVVQGEQYLVGGYYGVQIMNTTGNPSPVEKDESYEGPVFTLSKEKGWSNSFTVLEQETIGDAESDLQNVRVYSYYFEEIGCNPVGYTAKFYEHGTTTYAGDESHRIYNDNIIVDAVNGPASQLIVKKQWRGIPDTTGYPPVKFALYQTTVEGNTINSNGGMNSSGGVAQKDQSWPYGWGYQGKNEDISMPYGYYGLIELNQENNYTWVCPDNLPTSIQNPDNPSEWKKVGYFVAEYPRSGVYPETGTQTNWEFYSYYNDKGNITTNGDGSNHDNAGVVPNSQDEINGTITIVNKVSDYYQMDIKKQFFMIHDDGAWDNVTARMCQNVVLGFKVIRRVVFPDGSKSKWMDYGDEMLAGYDANGKAIFDNGTNGFWLHDGGGDWHFRIEENAGDRSSLEAGGPGLPKKGLYIDEHGDSISVTYEYSFRETDVYKDLARTPYPDWEWYSTITPDRYIGASGQQTGEFGIAFANQDGERVANYQASNIKIDKRWAGQPNAKEVYIKIWRQAGDKTPEDFTEVIAKDVVGDYPPNHPAYGNSNWQGYVEDTSIVDTTHNWLILKANRSGDWTTTVNIHNALIGEAGEDQGEHYTYYTQEVGYKDKNGVIHLIAGLDTETISDLVNAGATVDSDDAIDDLETHYFYWKGGLFGAWVERGDPSWVKNAISIGEKDTNKLQTVNVPKMDLTVDKKWFDEQGLETEPWQDEIHFQIEQVSTKWVGGEPTTETRKANVKIGSEDVFTISKNATDNTHAVIDLVNRAENHYAYNINNSGEGKAWQFYVDGLYEGYFDENNDEWHCVYTIKEVDTPKSEVTIDNNDVSTDGETVTINNKKTNTGSVKITKVFSGIEALPDSFVINARWTDNEGTHNLGLKVTGRQPNNVTLTGDGSEGNPYVWTISKIPFGTDVEVTFTENAFNVDGYVVTVSSKTDTLVSNTNATTTVEVAQDVIKKGNFTNAYRAVTGGIKVVKKVTGNKVLQDGQLSADGVLITNDLADGEYFFRLFAEDKKTRAKYANGKQVEDFSIIIAEGESEPFVIDNLKPGKYYVMEINGSNPAVELDYTMQEVTVVGDINGEDIENSSNSAGLATVTNRMPMIEVQADKKWVRMVGEEETDLGWPNGAKATFGVFAGDSTTPLARVELVGIPTPAEDIPEDGDTPEGYEAVKSTTEAATETTTSEISSTSDSGGQTEDTDQNTEVGGLAIFKNLPQKDKNGKTIVYTIKEIGDPEGFINQNPDGVPNGGTIKNKEEDKVALPLDILKKEKGSEKTLDGATFTITKMKDEITGNIPNVDDTWEIPTSTTENGGKASFTELPAGYYEVKETGVPTGYIITGDDHFYVKVEKSGIKLVKIKEESGQKSWEEVTSIENVQFTAAHAEENALATVENTPGAALPNTGGMGTTIFYLIGAVMTLGAGLLLVQKRRMAG
ncbi:MAG: Cna B-type domain-containing protein [Blautia sp.]|nr:Cna B-type domain-containing protein [Blautia sp.]